MDARGSRMVEGRGRRDGNGQRPRRSLEPRVEGFETRELLSGVVAEFAPLPATTKANGPIAVVDGNLWYVETAAGDVTRLGKLTPSGARSQLDLPSDEPVRISGVVGDDLGHLWYARAGATGGAPSIGRVARDGSIHEFPIGQAGDTPGDAALGADGNVWVALDRGEAGAALARVGPNGASTVVTVQGASQLRDLTLGPDGNLWFVDHVAIGKVGSDGKATLFPIASPDGSPVDLGNAQLTPASDGNVWFIGLGGISRITPWGSVKTLGSPGVTYTSIGKAADGNIWFSYLPSKDSPYGYAPGAILGRLTPDGRAMILPDHVETADAPIVAMASGRDGGLWLQEGASGFSRANLAAIPSFEPPIVRPTTTSTLTITQGTQFTGAVASFVPSGSGTVELRKYIAVIDWGDGIADTATLVPNSSAGYDVVGTHRYTAAAGQTLDVRVVIHDAAGGSGVIFNRATIVAPEIPKAPWQNYPVAPNQPLATTPVPAGTTTSTVSSTPSAPATTSPTTSTPTTTSPTTSTPTPTTTTTEPPKTTTGGSASTSTPSASSTTTPTPSAPNPTTSTSTSTTATSTTSTTSTTKAPTSGSSSATLDLGMPLIDLGPSRTVARVASTPSTGTSAYPTPTSRARSLAGSARGAAGGGASAAEARRAALARTQAAGLARAMARVGRVHVALAPYPRGPLATGFRRAR